MSHKYEIKKDDKILKAIEKLASLNFAEMLKDKNLEILTQTFGNNKNFEFLLNIIQDIKNSNKKDKLTVHKKEEKKY